MSESPQEQPRREFLLRGAIASAAAGWTLTNGRSSRADDDNASPILRCLDAAPVAGTALAVVVGDVPLVHTEQVFAGVAPNSEREAALTAIEQALEQRVVAAGGRIADVVRYHFYVASNDWVPLIQRRLAMRYSGDYQPAATFVTGAPAEPSAQVAADCIAVRREPVVSGKVLRFDGAAVLPPRNKLYISGDAKPGDVKTATLATLASLENTLRFAGLDWSHVVQLKSFLEPIKEAAIARAAMREFFGDRPIPVLSFVEWHSPSLPIEIELIAAVPEESANKTMATVEFLTPPGMTASPVFSRAARLRSRETIYTSGLYGRSEDDSAARVRGILRDLGGLVERGGGSMRKLVKATYYVGNDEASNDLGKIRPEFYQPDSPPAASKAMTKGVGRDGHALVVDMIAAGAA